MLPNHAPLVIGNVCTLDALYPGRIDSTGRRRGGSLTRATCAAISHGATPFRKTCSSASYFAPPRRSRLQRCGRGRERPSIVRSALQAGARSGTRLPRCLRPSSLRIYGSRARLLSPSFKTSDALNARTPDRVGIFARTEPRRGLLTHSAAIPRRCAVVRQIAADGREHGRPLVAAESRVRQRIAAARRFAGNGAGRR